jgi:hypothetical protein
MSVSHVVYDKTINITPITPSLEGDEFSQFDLENEHFKLLQRVISLNTDAVFLQSSDK